MNVQVLRVDGSRQLFVDDAAVDAVALVQEVVAVALPDIS